MSAKSSFHALSFLAVFALPACTSSVLSKRTDEQAWLEFQKDQKSKRAPASAVDAPETIQTLHAHLEEVPLRKILLSCAAGPSAESCYQSKLLLAFDETFRKSQAKSAALSDVVYKKERDSFLKTRSYESISAEVQTFHQLLLSGMDLRAVDHVRDLNQDCESEVDRSIDAYVPFSGSEFEMPKGYFACLNESWESDADHLLEETTDRLGLKIVTPEAKEWIKQKQIYPVYTETTRSILEKKNAENAAAWKKAVSESASWIDQMDWSQPLNAFVKKESDGLRARYPFLAVEAELTELYQKRKKDFKKGVESP